ncbi:MAG: helix-turn-helix domain-containing protein [Spirochaetaceae bacterium]|jgi:transcriptional regulator with XRE-family HTH domain|nr:helix-turn-helix domain-containing protein [Spirochaetaceae bacterium]
MSTSFRENLRNELDYQNMTVKELSTKAGIPKPTLECYLRRRAVMPSAEAAVKIAKALKVSVEYLVTGEGDTREKLAVTPDPIARELFHIIESFDDMFRLILLAIAKSLKTQVFDA